MTLGKLSNNYKKDGSNGVAGTIDMDDHSIKNNIDPASNQDAANKNYVNKDTITVHDDFVRRDIKLAFGSE